MYSVLLTSALSSEIALLKGETSQLLGCFPRTLWPMSHILRRLARLLLCLVQPIVEEVDFAITCLDIAYGTLQAWNHLESRPLSLALLLEKVDAQFKAVNTLMNDPSGWREDPRVSAYLVQAGETLEIARDVADDLFGMDGAVMKDMIDRRVSKVMWFETEMALNEV